MATTVRIVLQSRGRHFEIMLHGTILRCLCCSWNAVLARLVRKSETLHGSRRWLARLLLEGRLRRLQYFRARMWLPRRFLLLKLRLDCWLQEGVLLAAERRLDLIQGLGLGGRLDLLRLPENGHIEQLDDILVRSVIITADATRFKIRVENRLPKSALLLPIAHNQSLHGF